MGHAHELGGTCAKRQGLGVGQEAPIKHSIPITEPAAKKQIADKYDGNPPTNRTSALMCRLGSASSLEGS